MFKMLFDAFVTDTLRIKMNGEDANQTARICMYHYHMHYGKCPKLSNTLFQTFFVLLNFAFYVVIS